MGGTPVMIIGRTCDTLFNRLMDFVRSLSFLFCVLVWRVGS